MHAQLRVVDFDGLDNALAEIRKYLEEMPKPDWHGGPVRKHVKAVLALTPSAKFVCWEGGYGLRYGTMPCTEGTIVGEFFNRKVGIVVAWWTLAKACEDELIESAARVGLKLVKPVPAKKRKRTPAVV